MDKTALTNYQYTNSETFEIVDILMLTDRSTISSVDCTFSIMGKYNRKIVWHTFSLTVLSQYDITRKYPLRSSKVAKEDNIEV